VILLSVLAVVGLVLSLINFYLSFIRRLLFNALGKATQYKWASGIPLIGSLLLWVSSVGYYLQGKTILSCISIAASLLDTGGIHWFIGSMLYHALKKKEMQSGA
jgi:hypothetical protein